MVVKESLNMPGNTAGWWWNQDPSLAGDGSLALPRRRKYSVAVWRAVERNSKRCINRDMVLGLVAMLGISAAGWAGVAVLISHLVR